MPTTTPLPLPTSARRRYGAPYAGRHRHAAAPLLRARSVLALVALVVAAAVGPAAWSPATAFTWFNTLCKSFATCNTYGLGNAGYQNVYTQSFFGMYPGHNCTNYAAYRLKARGINASYLAGQGNGYQWGPVAASRGVRVDKTPQVGDIAWFDQKAGLSSNGHVAYVEAVDPTTKRVKVSEDNWGGDFDWRWYLIADVTGFIHFGGAPSSTSSFPPANGTYVRIAENGQVYRIAGGAPIYVTSFAGFGSVPPITSISAAAFATLPAYPADGTFLTGTDGRVYRVAGGAPLYVSSWTSFGGQQPTTLVDAATIANAGGSGVFGHLLAAPRNGSFLRNTADGRTYVVAGGAPLAVPSWSAYGAPQPYTAIDPWELTHGPHLRSLPTDVFLRGGPSGRLVHVSGGRPLGFTSWTAFGGQQPVTVVDDATLAACDHLLCSAFGRLDAVTAVPGGATLSGWADDPDTGDPVQVSLESDGVRVATSPASVSRPDVDAVYHHGAARGFSAAVTLPSGTHQVCARAIGVGAGDPSTLLGCASVQVSAGSTVTVAPARIVDTRTGLGGQSGATGPGRTTTVTVTGRGGVPATGVTAVVLNVTVTGATRSGYLTVYPAGRARPKASNLNFAVGQTVPNLVLATVGSNGQMSLYNGSGGTVHLVVDVAGYVIGGSAVVAGSTLSSTPARVADTRTGLGVGSTAPLIDGAVRTVVVAGHGNVPPAGVAAVVVNVTTTGATGSGYVTAYAAGASRPDAANVQFAPGTTVPNLVLVPLGAGGAIQLYAHTSGSVHVVVDVAGWVLGGTPSTPGATLASTQSRLVDTRYGVGVTLGAVRSGTSVSLPVLGRSGVPASGVDAVVLNVTATRGTTSGYLTVYPGGRPRPLASNVNFRPQTNVANLVVVPVGANGTVSLYNGSPGSVDAVVDVVGWIRR
ncbi:CHAP domain-containing protein [Lapillicoccus jejuensis]|uniref:CHAP domain-containing protein n=1 Tax=Lapillicoccus jejuensis TaxID=402171 RepID=A0A542E5K4_9MICO|nr:CHAP domain-containing protein [Lapillicoccus jejuensis]TQJ10549.1 CHAP domain-containing protein [Lapillicoccus jejuensis]